MGKILRVNLSTGSISTEEVSAEDQKLFLGGQGVAAALFTREVDPGADPLGEANKIIFSVGPYCGTTVPFCGRHFVIAKSPLTGIIGEASAGGFWGKEFKTTGFDHIIVEGKSDKPVYLWITDGKAEIKDAGDLWGKTTSETEAALKSTLGDDKIKVTSIGPAGENLVKFAAIMSEEDRAAGRCGLGAVLGSKKLKAIVVRGTGKVPIVDNDKLLEAAKNLRAQVKENALAGVYSDTGTPTAMDTNTGIGDVPVKNFTLSRWGGTKGIGAAALKERGIKHHACFGCPVACTGLVEYEGKWVRWPEYETLAMMGSNLLVDDLETIIRWNVLVNDLGMDTISLGSVMAMFVEALEWGQIPQFQYEDWGFKPDPEKKVAYEVWGVKEPLDKLIKMIANREGLGNDLAEGVQTFAKKYDLPEDLRTVGKGLEVPAHEPRANNLTALDYATTIRGAYHCYLPMNLSTMMGLKKELGLTTAVPKFDADKTVVDAVIKIQDSSEAYSACGGCIFGYTFTEEITPWVESFNAITGLSLSVDDWVAAGARMFNLKRKWCCEAGISKTADTIGSRFFKPIARGGTRKNIPPIQDMLPIYYELRGWTAEGIPPA